MKKLLSLILTGMVILLMLPTKTLAANITKVSKDNTNIVKRTSLDTPYSYRDPRDVLIDTYRYSEAEADQILSYTYMDDRIHYVETLDELQLACSNPDVEIVVLTNSISIPESIFIDKSLAILSPEPVELISSAEEGKDDWVNVMIKIGDENNKFENDLELIFSNVVINCNGLVGGIISNVTNMTNSTISDRYITIEGAYVKDAYYYQEGTNVRFQYSIHSTGNTNLIGCVADGGSSEFNVRNLGGKCKYIDCYLENSEDKRFGDGLSLTGGYAKSIEIDGFLSGRLMTQYNTHNGLLRINNSSAYYSQIENCDNVDISGLTGGGISFKDINAISMTNVKAGYITADFNNDTDTLTLRDSEIVGDEKYTGGLSLYGGQNEIINTKIHGAQGYGVYVNSEGQINSKLKMNNCDIYNNNVGLEVSNTKSNEITDCRIYDNSTRGFQSYSPMRAIITDCVISNNGYAPRPNAPYGQVGNQGGACFEYHADKNIVGGAYIRGTKFINNKSQGNGGAIYSPNWRTPNISIQDCEFIGNQATGDGGAIFIGSYTSFTVTSDTVFRDNLSGRRAFYPPDDVAIKYPNIKGASASILTHPLNNYDIRYLDGVEVARIISIDPLPVLSVKYGTSVDQVQAKLEENYTLAQASLHDGDTNQLPIIWNVSGSSYNGDIRGMYTICGVLDLTGKEIVNPTSLTADVEVQVTADIVSVQEFEEYAVNYGTPVAEVQSALEEKYPQAKVTLSDGQELDFPVNWNVASSDYNGDAYGTYLVSGEIIFADEPEVRNPDGLSTEIEVRVNHKKELEIIDIPEVPLNVRQYVLLSNINKPTDLPGHEKPTTAKLSEKVTVKLKDGGTAELPVNWNVEGYDSSKVGVQNFTGEVVTDGTQITNPDSLAAPLEISVSAADYMFIQAAPTDISVEVLPGTSVEEVNAILVEEGKADISLNAFDMESGKELYTFYRMALQEKDCADYQKDVPGQYDFTVPWPDNIFIADGLEDTEIQVHVTVLEPLDIIGVDTATISPYQSVPYADYTDIPAKVNVTLDGGLKIPVDVEWDWSAFNPDVAGEQIVIGELVNLPSKAKQPEGKEFTGKLAVSVQPVDYKITNREYGMIQSDAALTLAEITELQHPTVLCEITSVTEGVDLTLEREVAVMLEDEKNPEYDPKVAKEYYLTGTLDLPENITYDNEEQLFDEILLLTEPVDILSFTTENITASEGTPFEDIQFKPTEVEAVLSAVGPDGKNKTEIIAVNWSGEGYNPFPEGLTDDEPLAETVTGSLVNKPAYIKTPKKVKPILFIKVGREFIIESITPNRFPETGAMEVPLGSGLKDIESKLEQRTVSVNLLSTNGVRSTTELTYTLEDDELNQGYDPDTLGTYTLTATLPLEDNYRNPDNLKVEVVVETMTYFISTTKITTLAGIVSGTPFEELPLPAKAIAVRDDDVDEELDVTWDGSNYNPTKIGAQFINGTFNTPLPKHLENPDNRQPKAFVTVVRPNAKILSMEQVFDQPAVMLMSAAEPEEEFPGYTEHKYLVKLQNEDGSIEEQIISMYTKDK